MNKRLIASPIIFGVQGILNPLRASYLAAECGFQGMQMLPFRRMGEPSMYGLPVCYYEGAWNSGTLQECLRGHFTSEFDRALDTPTLIDWVFFPHGDRLTQNMQQFDTCSSRPTEIVHTFREFLRLRSLDVPCLLEVSPMLGMNVLQVKMALIQANIHERCLVLDTWHVLRHPTPVEARVHKLPPLESPFGNWEAAITSLAPHVAVVHVQPSRIHQSELLNFIEPSLRHFTMLGSILNLVASQCSEVTDYVVEYSPGLKNSINTEKTRSIATAIQERVRSIIMEPA